MSDRPLSTSTPMRGTKQPAPSTNITTSTTTTTSSTSTPSSPSSFASLNDPELTSLTKVRTTLQGLLVLLDTLTSDLDTLKYNYDTVTAINRRWDTFFTGSSPSESSSTSNQE
eukprot:TRINITY_DN6667_c1_g1_i1.p1 TRINITY_DN6667_c1_g1~~TRINITY_DN6667_c1_g1_i1.p1  ORF type:complete len:113 (+),score=15.20 TRINITY_DN6667_c1_g1_i1:142-480(+)